MADQEELFSPWVAWELTKWERLYIGFSPRAYAKNSTIFLQGSTYTTLFIIAKGRVRISAFSTDGNEKQMYIAEKGAICCESSTIHNQPFSSSAMALVDCEIYEIPLEHVYRVLEQDWGTTKEFIKYLARKNMAFSHQITQLSFAQSLQRIAGALLNLSQQYGRQTPRGILIDIKFTHQDMAGMVNVTRVTVSNLFGLLMDEEVLGKFDGYFYITDIEKLKSFL